MLESRRSGINILFWALAPFFCKSTRLSIFFGCAQPWYVILLANYSLVSSEVLYLLGLKANLDERGVRGLWKRLYSTILQAILLPGFSLMESIGVLAAILRLKSKATQALPDRLPMVLPIST